MIKPTGEPSAGQLVGSQSYRIITQYGDMLVIKQGIQHNPQTRHHLNHSSSPHHSSEQQPQQHQARPVIMTFHDIGLNSELQFAKFCDCDEVKLMLQTFTMIHVNFIGQEFDYSSNAASSGGSSSSTTTTTSPGQASAGSNKPANLPDDFKYPNVDQMAESIVDICTQLKVRSFIAMAVGAGAYIVSSLALMRPDLIDGLFLINPVITNCSITEWLYFKMSAIAGNHYIGTSSDHSSSSSSQHNQSTSSSPKSGLRKLISAATHLHLHHHHQHHHHQHHNHQHHNEDEPTGLRSASPDDAGSIGHESVQSSGTTNSNDSSSNFNQKSNQSSGSRLRQLIFSRNLRNFSTGSSNSSFNKHHLDRKQAKLIDDQDQTLADAQADCDSSASTTGSIPEPETRAAQQQQRESGGKRPPFEYLIYHHFGPTSFQRYRRSSDTSAHNNQSSASGSQSELTCGNNDNGSEQSVSGSNQQESGSSSSRKNSSPSGSLGCTSSAKQQQASRPSMRRHRSGSVCMNATYLASFPNDRQRQAYIQSAYKQYFYQINSHNLWLFAQSFVKRRTLNLRKDCGAAAHAAAAAATLGTSICTAFVGLAPGATSGQAATSSNSKADGEQQKQEPPARHRTTPMTNMAANSPKQQQAAQALVAGTKVKRTFTCQTLIMCSSVPMHCERAFKLMSLLNPLQATWIKTDHLLVLEERPDKVCQALRLFLQGIGYSMSTYERRLRLSSTTGSAGSADSSSSARSYTADATG